MDANATAPFGSCMAPVAVRVSGPLVLTALPAVPSALCPAALGCPPLPAATAAAPAARASCGPAAVPAPIARAPDVPPVPEGVLSVVPDPALPPLEIPLVAHGALVLAPALGADAAPATAPWLADTCVTSLTAPSAECPLVEQPAAHSSSAARSGSRPLFLCRQSMRCARSLPNSARDSGVLVMVSDERCMWERRGTPRVISSARALRK